MEGPNFEKFNGRRAHLTVTFDGVDITDSLTPYLLSMTYTDNEEGQSDDLQITLQDRDGIWLESWLTDAIEAAASAKLKIHARIDQEQWGRSAGADSLDCGEFELDEVEASGPPSEITIKAVSLPFSSAISQTLKSRAWENFTLSRIANEIAWENGMGCMYESARDPEYEREEQTATSDILFLQKLCEDAAISLKATGTDLVLFDQIKYESQTPQITIRRGEGYTSYNLTSSSGDRQYSSCRVSWIAEDGSLIEGIAKTEDFLADEAKEQLDAEKQARDDAIKAAEKAAKEAADIAAGKKKREKTAEELAEEAREAAEEAAKEAEEAAKEARLKAQEIAQQRLEIYEKVATAEEAQALAEKRLRYANKLARTAEFTYPGKPGFVAGITADLVGWGAWDGRYLVYQTQHTVDGNGGYETQVSLRRILEGY